MYTRLQNTRGVGVFKEVSLSGNLNELEDKLSWSFAIKGPSTFHFNSWRTQFLFIPPPFILITTSVREFFLDEGKKFPLLQGNFTKFRSNVAENARYKF